MEGGNSQLMYGQEALKPETGEEKKQAWGSNQRLSERPCALDTGFSACEPARQEANCVGMGTNFRSIYIEKGFYYM